MPFTFAWQLNNIDCTYISNCWFSLVGILNFDNISLCLQNLTLNKQTYLKCWFLNQNGFTLFNQLKDLKTSSEKKPPILPFFIKIWVLCHLSDWASSCRESINLFWFHVGRRSRMVACVHTNSNITWPSSELCSLRYENYPTWKKGQSSWRSTRSG